MKKSLKIFIVSLLLIPSTIFALTKKETVYSNLDYYGKVNSTMVTNHIYNSEKTTLEDETELTNIMNINGKEKFELKDGILSWKAMGTDIFYRGSTNKVLPIDTKITYYLNDRKMNIEDMVGKKGKVKIVLDFKNNVPNLVKVNNTFQTLYTPFVVTVGTILDSDSKNINITNGKVINTGTKSVLVGLSSPGIYESIGIESFKNLDEIVITYDTTNFKLNNIYIASTPKLLEESDLEIFDKMDSLYGNMNELKSNMDLIEKSVKEIEDGVSTLGAGSSTITSGLDKTLQAMKQVRDGSTSLDDGIGLAITGLESTKYELGQYFKQYGIDLNNDNINLLKESLTYSLGIANDTINSNIPSIDLSLVTIEYLYSLPLPEEQKSSILKAKQVYDTNVMLINVLNTDIVNNLIVNISNLEQGLNELKEGSSSLRNGTAELYNGLYELNQGMKELNNGIIKLNDGTKKLNSGVKEFNSKGITTLYNYSLNIRDYTSKAEALLNLSNSYKGYTSKLTDSTLFISIVKSAK